MRDIVVSKAGIFYICGRNGTLIAGDERGFSPIITNIDDYLKSMAFFNDEFYVGGSKGLYKLVQQSLQPVLTNQNSPFNCVELDAYDGELLVVSDRWFLVFDGKNGAALTTRITQTCCSVNDDDLHFIAGQEALFNAEKTSVI